MKKRQLRISTQDFGFGILVSALLLLFAAGVTGCSKVKDPDKLSDGEYPMTFTAAMEEQTTPQVAQIATRATSGNTWVGNEEVAIQIEGEVKKYTITNAANGTLSAHSDNEPFYWQNTTEQKSLSAWTPFSAVQPSSFTVETDQSGDGYRQSDLIYVAPTTLSYGSNQTITFKHLPVKMVVNVKAGKGVTQNEVTNATITLLNQNLTSGAIADNWSVTQQTAPGSDAITPNVLTTTTAGYQKTVQALLVPQTIAAGARMLQISIGTGLFYYTPTAEQSLAAGNQYNYQITVNATGLTVTTQISDWTTEEVAGDAEMSIGSKSDPATAAIGDFYFSDGSLEDKDATLTTEQKAACVGIVYWVGDPTNTTNGDPLLATQHPGCTHGLVVALHDAKQPSTNAAAKMKWSVSYEQVNNWTNSDDRGVNKVNITDQNRYQGYANTVALKAYNNESTNVQGDPNFKVLPIEAIEQYETDYPAPAGSSGWYVPSIMELKYVCWGQGNGQGITGQDLLNGQFAKAGGTNFDGLWIYWSSSEDAGNSLSAWSVRFDDGLVDDYSKSYVEFWVRALFAF